MDIAPEPAAVMGEAEKYGGPVPTSAVPIVNVKAGKDDLKRFVGELEPGG
jgi:hypothetical protein